ncbi:MAG: ferredoxin [Deltaproteobacteria bacterium ADurb.Bin151]|jgi:MinD superfamily P-loop ATPase|nr:4Fe-4S binding protein [Smithella sp.]OQB54162.1 MAG: ferredoxin [Deltaproteobacteria bacterium ADurb.Bin151]HNZ10969.1 ATP-binding protein [Smithellaceae bacterium]HOG80912.1 ATP-binding protein [Smithellaceae bacterium]HOQ42199.1 ATP-binding protein [Smithellaceae bacterium]
MRELVIVSGKGGTGKTSVTASLAALADHPVICDCDVDAADLHLILEPKIRENHDFLSGHEAVIRERDCIGCGICQDVCRFDAITNDVDTFSVDPIACEGCGVCVHFCPQKAIDFPESLCGKWFVSETRLGPMVHAKLGVAAENSGKLVSLVRTEAKHLAEEENRRLVIVDGPPGIGCPVIASITGASQVLVVTEPTVSGEHDLERVLGLARHFQIPALVCINKWDINEEMTIRIEQKARDLGAGIAGRIRYDQAVTRAQILQKTVVETDAASAQDIRQIWDYLNAQEDALK